MITMFYDGTCPNTATKSQRGLFIKCLVHRKWRIIVKMAYVNYRPKSG